MKPYDRYINSLINDDDPDIQEIGNDAKSKAWKLDFYGMCDTSTEQSVKDGVEHLTGESYSFFLGDMTVTEAIEKGYISIYNHYIAFWCDSL